MAFHRLCCTSITWCCAACQESGRRGVRKAWDICPQPPLLLIAGAVGLEVFLRYIRQDSFLQMQFTNQALEMDIRLFQLLESLGLIHFRSAKFTPPAVVALVCRARLPAGSLDLFFLR